jgi:hypothetical protein
MYITALEYYMVGCTNMTALDLFLHLTTTYGMISPTELAENYHHMTAPYDMQDPVETLFTQIDSGVRYANSGGLRYHDTQYVNITFLLSLDTGVLPEACCKWNQFMIANQT